MWRGRRTRENPRVMLIATSILVVFFGFAVWTVLPHPSDLNFLVPFRRHPGPLVSILNWLIRSISSICEGVARPGIFAVPLWIFLTIRLGRKGDAFYLLPIATFALFSGYYFSFWHAGLIVPAAIAICWVAWADIWKPMTWSVLTVILAFCITMQIAWTVYSATYHPYSSDPETARFLAPHVAAGETIALTYVKDDSSNASASIGLYPYFSRPIFVNQPRPFWLWSTRENTFDQFKQAMKSSPTMVLVVFSDPVASRRFDPSKDLEGPRVELVEKNGYRLTHRFCAEIPQGLGWGNSEICNLIFERPLPGDQ
jgi:hypothetical protein